MQQNAAGLSSSASHADACVSEGVRKSALSVPPAAAEVLALIFCSLLVAGEGARCELAGLLRLPSTFCDVKIQRQGCLCIMEDCSGLTALPGDQEVAGDS